MRITAGCVGSDVLARAGRESATNADFWREMAQETPGSIKFVSTHPTSAERFLRLEQTHDEIERKRAGHEPLVPEMKGAQPRQ